MNISFSYLHFSCCIIVLLLLSSCASKRNLVYLSDISDTADYQSKITNITEPRIQSGDLLAITVSNIDPESSNLFNKGILPVTNISALPSNMSTADPSGYLVDKAGSITFPAIGKVQLAGLTLEEGVAKIRTDLSTYAKDPIVTIKLMNFKITVIGEVSKPGVFNISNGRVNVLEALGLAGDMTIYGRREDIWIMREENGSRSITHLDLTSKNTLQSPSFYLQQNDVLYIKPDKLKERQARTNTRTLSIVVAAATIVTVIISRLF
ncbi:polysaccharide biosynthesis/export family protein [Pedobacter psychroterrae]|uniref:Sugar transporter n=1 Tax=Pedobacter psychroterrae TaxID=2530453 RepID=A0A4R0N9J7_9SPHI|nr:polysaccharide biosynthesis/export family protein [Pedobacter psychroterrae]TCC96878.1 sugar transporter [Pedobacter psychroterrae]